MKPSILFLLLFILLPFCSSQAQDRVNIITKSQFEAIKFNNKTIQQISGTLGAESAVHSMFGSSSSIDKNDAIRSKIFLFSGNSIYFGYKKGFVNGRVEAIEINNSQWPVVIKGQTIRVGDSEASLKQKLGSDLKIFNYNPPSGGTIRLAGFNYSTNDYDLITIYTNPSTQKVSQIKYLILP